MFKGHVLKLLSIGLLGALLGAGGLVAIVIMVLSSVHGTPLRESIDLSGIGCPSGMVEDLSKGKCVISTQSKATISYVLHDLVGLKNIETNQGREVLKRAAKEIQGNSKEKLALFYFAALLGDPESQFIVGGMISNGEGADENDLEALKWLHEAAHNNYRKAQLRLAYMLSKGGFVEKDVVEALRWLKRAEENGKLRKLDRKEA